MESSAGQPGLLEIRTRDRDVIAEALNAVVTHRAHITFDDAGDVDLSMRSREHGAIGALRLRLGGVSYAASSEPVGYLLGAVVEGGDIAVRIRGRDFALGPDDGMLFPVGHPFVGEYGRSALGAVSLPLPYVAELAETETGLPAADLRFEGAVPVSAAMRRHWSGAAGYLCRQLTAPGVAPPPPVRETARRWGFANPGRFAAEYRARYGRPPSRTLRV